MSISQTPTKENHQGFFYIIPALLVENGEPTKALLFGLVTSLANQYGYCYASNSFLAKKLKIKSATYISTLIKELKKEGWLYTEIDKEKGNKRKVYPIINKSNRPIPLQSNRSSTVEQDPYSSTVEQSNINIVKEESKEAPPPPRGILEQLNKTGNYLPSKKQLMKVLQVNEFRAKDIEVILKGLDIDKRKEYLASISNNQQPVTGSEPEGKKEIEVKLKPAMLAQLEELASFYESRIKVKVNITNQDKAEYQETRRIYKASEILYVARNCYKAVNTLDDNFYSINFKQIVRMKTIDRLITHPLLKKMEND